MFGRFHDGRLGGCVGDPCIGAAALSSELLKTVRVEIKEMAVWFAAAAADGICHGGVRAILS